MLRPVPTRTFLHSARRARSSGRAGFTLVELMAVVTIISIFAAIAAPSFIEALKSRRVQRDALALLIVLQDAKTRAIGRGGAVRVVFDPAATNGSDLLKVQEVYDDVDADGTYDLPSYTCGGTVNPFLVSTRAIGDFSGRSSFGVAVGATTSATVEKLCFTPRGRTYREVDGQWVALGDALTFTVTPLDGDGSAIDGARKRRVLLGPTGDARMVL